MIGNQPSVVPVGTEFLTEKTYPGLNWATFMPSLRDCGAPSNLFRFLKTYFGKVSIPPYFSSDTAVRVESGGLSRSTG